MHDHAVRPHRWDAFRRDFLASIVVFLIALPLCLGLAIASGAPPMAGLVTGIVGGILVGLLAGCPLQVSGPAAGLVAIVYEIIHLYGLEGLGVIVFLAGLMQLAAGFLQVGQWFRAVSPAVIKGMLAGIGVLIVCSQFHVMLDFAPASTGLANILNIPESIQGVLTPADGKAHHWAAMLGGMSLALMVLWDRMPAKVRLVPAALVAVLLAVAASVWFALPVQHVQMPGDLLSGLTLPGWQTLSLLTYSGIWIAALTVAVVASAETMLSASAVDRLQDRTPRTQYNRELLAQGVGNSLCGLLGGLPMTGVIVRSSANIQAGAVSRASTVLHGCWLLVLVALAPFVLEAIPTAALAAILVFTGYKLVQPAMIRRLWQTDRGDFAVYMVTMLTVVATNLLEGVIAGTLLAMFRLLLKLSRLEGVTQADPSGEQVALRLRGSATFLSIPKLVRILEGQPQGKRLSVQMDELAHVDQASLEILQSYRQEYAMSGGQMTVDWKKPSTEDRQPDEPRPALVESSVH